MTSRTCTHVVLLLAALLQALPVAAVRAAETAPDSTLGAPAVESAPAAPELVPEIEPTEAPDAAVLDQPAIEDIELQVNADVLKYIAFFSGAGRSTFERWLKRSGRYMELFRNVLQKEGLPPDLVHLVFVESGFNVNARSYASAVGPWQFMRATSQLFGLHVNQWVDERKDPEKATVAAARYLKHLYSIFGDWPLALASYNAGEGTVLRAIKAQGTTNYWELKLPKQTEDYVPQFMAALAITRDPVKYGFGDIQLDDPMRFDEVALKGAVDLRAIARLADCTVADLRELNPSVRNNVIQNASGVTTLRVPEGRSEVIQRRLAEGEALPKVDLTVRHRVRKGETLKTIAREYSVSPTELARVNRIGKRNPLKRGMLLTVPASMRAPRPEVLVADGEDPRASTDYVPQRRIGLPGKVEGNSIPIERITHVVKRGETLSTIAARYGVSVADLRTWNRIRTPSVRTGTRLRIRNASDAPADSAAVATSTPEASKPDAVSPATAVERDTRVTRTARTRMHTVKAGETLSTIATRHGITVTQLKKLNHLTSNRIRTGQRLRLPA